MRQHEHVQTEVVCLTALRGDALNRVVSSLSEGEPMAWFPPRFSPIQRGSLRTLAGEFPTPPQYDPLSEGLLRPCLYSARGRPGRARRKAERAWFPLPLEVWSSPGGERGRAPSEAIPRWGIASVARPASPERGTARPSDGSTERWCSE